MRPHTRLDWPIICLLLAIVAAPADAQRVAGSAVAPRVPVTLLASSHDQPLPASLSAERTLGEHVVIGATIGAAVGLVAGIIASRSCPCGGYPVRYDDAIIPAGMILGAIAGAITGLVVHGSRGSSP